MNVPPLNPYLKTRVMTASPVELRLLLYDGALKFLDQGIEGLNTQNYEKVYEGFSQCQAIVMELMNSLRPEHAPELVERLNGLYTFMYLQLVKATHEKDLDAAMEVRKLLNYERETWQLLMEQLKDENVSGAEAAAAVAENAADVPSTPPAQQVPDSLIGARVSIRG